MNAQLENLFRSYLQLIPQVADQLDDEESRQVGLVLQAIQQYIQEAQSTTIEPTIPSGASLLWHLAGRNPQAFVSYTRSIPDPSLRQLSTNPQLLNHTIEHLERQFPSQGVPQGTLYPSSNVAAINYDPKTQQLMVKFHGENQEPVYRYFGVPPKIADLLWEGNAFARTKGQNKFGKWWPMKNPSIGAALNQFIKDGGFAYQRVA